MNEVDEANRNANRAFLTGNLLGLCMKAEKEQESKEKVFGFGEVEIAVNEDGDYEYFFYITRESGRYKISIDFADETEGTIEI